MGRRKITIPEKELRDLYLNQGKSPAEIGDIFGCSTATIRNRLKEFKIPLKDPAEARMQYKKNDFSGSVTEKAYMVGFSVGDLNAYLPNKETSKTVVVRSHSTHDCQVELFREIFKSYGQVTESRNESGSVYSNCYLNTTFAFLLEKYSDNIRNWINDQEFTAKTAFIAGYTDAEGSFGINQGKARFKIDSYDYTVLKDINAWIEDKKIHTIFRRIGKKGEINSMKKEWAEDLWRFQINEAISIKRFIDFVSPFLRHRKRVKDSHDMLKNIKLRQNNGTIS